MNDEEIDPGITGKKLSKTEEDPREIQRKALYDKYLDAQILWIREYTPETKAAFDKISAEYKRQFDR